MYGFEIFLHWLFYVMDNMSIYLYYLTVIYLFTDI